MEKELISRLIKFAFDNKISHLSSSLTALPIIYEIYKKKRQDDIFILSQGHAALALYVILEHFENTDLKHMFASCGVHPHRNASGIFCSTGSLGMGLPIAVGAALADRERKVHCLISDGECYEGSIWESLNFINEHKLNNLTVHVNANGYRAYGGVNLQQLEKRLKAFLPSIKFIRTNIDKYPFLSGLNGHYHVMDAIDYKEWRNYEKSI